MAELVCPKCHEATKLWAVCSFEGWHSVDAVIDERHRRGLNPAEHGRPYYEITGRDAYDFELSEMGCTCGWEGDIHQLVQLGSDGQPLPTVHPEQIAFEA